MSETFARMKWLRDDANKWFMVYSAVITLLILGGFKFK